MCGPVVVLVYFKNCWGDALWSSIPDPNLLSCCRSRVSSCLPRFFGAGVGVEILIGRIGALFP